MPREQEKPGSPADWLAHALSDLAVARLDACADLLPETQCFHAQQAAEKALKAVLIARGIGFPKTHDIRELLDLMPSNIDVPEQVRQAARLSVYAVHTRYPGFPVLVTTDHLVRALVLAQAAFAWAEGLIRKGQSDKSNQ